MKYLCFKRIRVSQEDFKPILTTNSKQEVSSTHGHVQGQVRCKISPFSSCYMV